MIANPASLVTSFVLLPASKLNVQHSTFNVPTFASSFILLLRLWSFHFVFFDAVGFHDAVEAQQ